MKNIKSKNYIPAGSGDPSLPGSSAGAHDTFSQGFFPRAECLSEHSAGAHDTFPQGPSSRAGCLSGHSDEISVFIGRTAAVIAAILISSSALAPLAIEAKEKEKDENKIYSEAIFSADGLEDYMAEQAYNKNQPIETNQVDKWPEGPAVGAAGAIVMDANSGTILYGKNIDKRLYPASITKVMTGLLVIENLDPADKITFSESSIHGIEMGSSNIGMDIGETITVDEAMYGLMVASANEVAVALAEKVSGSEEAFADLMNARAKELGCENTHFVTSNGLHREDHYTCARDMALIAKEAYRHPELIKYMSQMNYHFEKTDTQPDDFWILNTNDFLTGEIHCEDVIGGKTGYTDQARETLVTFAERDGIHLICVIMREEPPYEFYDTIDLLNYGFENFKSVNISKNENRFLMKSPDFLSSGDDIFGRTTSSCMIPEDESLMIPEKASFSDLSAELSSFTYDLPEAHSGEAATAAAEGTAKPESEAEENASSGEDPSHILEDGTRVLGVLHYKYNGYEVGTADVLFREAQKTDSDHSDTVAEKLKGIRSVLFSLVHTGAHGSIYLNILLTLPIVLAFSFILCVFFFYRELNEERKRRSRRQRQRARRRPPDAETQSYDQEQFLYRPNSRYNSRSDSRSNSRYNSRSDSRSDSRSNGRSNGRSDSRSDSRSNGRSNSRSDSRSNGRSDSRSDSRSDTRTNTRSDRSSNRPPLDMS